MSNTTAVLARKRRHVRVRRKVRGTPERLRLNVYRSANHIYAQVIDDTIGHTVASAHDMEPGIEGGTKTERAASVGKTVAERAKAKGVETVVFDRGGYKFHGRVQALADAAREAGLGF